MSSFIAKFFATTFCALTCATCFSSPSFRLVTNGPSGEYISGGQPQLFVAPGGTEFASSLDLASPLGIDRFSFYATFEPGRFFTFTVGTDGLARNLESGFYPSAQRAPFAATGFAGIDVSMDGRGCNEISGSFFIHAVRFGSNAEVSYIDVSFTQFCEGGPPPLLGRFTYDVGGASLPALAPYESARPEVVPAFQSGQMMISALLLMLLGSTVLRRRSRRSRT
jgi:hypothetical protein